MYPFTYFNLGLADMCSGTIAGGARLRSNMYFMDLTARSNFYQVPYLQYNNFLYSNPFQLQSLEATMMNIWNTSMNQFAWKMNNQYNGQFNFNGGQMGTTPWWAGGSSSSSSSSSGPKIETETDKSFKEKFDKMKKYVEAILKEKDELDIDDEIVVELKEAMTLNSEENKSKTIKEVYEELQRAYQKIDDDIIIEYITSNETIKVKDSTSDKDTFYNRLRAAGYEFKGDEIDKDVKTLRRALEDLSENDPEIESEAGIVSAILVDDKVEILDVISSWNSEYRKDDEMGLIQYIMSKEPEDAPKGNDCQKAVENFSDKLIEKAEKALKSLNDDSKATLQEAIDTLNELVDASDKDYDEISVAFDDLYIKTRIATMQILRADAQRYYKDIDAEMYDADLLQSEIVKDFEKEGFETDDIDFEGLNTKRKVTREGQAAPAAAQVDDNADADNGEVRPNAVSKQDKTINEVKEYSKETFDGIIVEGKSYDVYTLKSDSDYKFIVKEDGKIYKVNGESVGKEISKKDLKEAEEAASTNKNMGSAAKTMMNVLYHHNTDKSKVDKYVNTTLKNINQDNIMDFLNVVYFDNDATSRINPEKFFERISQHCKDGDKDLISASTEMHVVEEVIKLAENSGISEDSKYLKQLKEIRDKHLSGGFYANKSFDNKAYEGYKNNILGTGNQYAEEMGAGIGHIIGWAVGLTTADQVLECEIIDTCIKKIYYELKFKQPKTKEIDQNA